MLTFAGTPLVIESREERGGKKTRRDRVRIGIPRANGTAIGPADELEESSKTGGVISVPSHGSDRSGLSHQARADHDDAGIRFARGLVANADTVDSARCEALENNIRPFKDAFRDFACAFVLEVDR